MNSFDHDDSQLSDYLDINKNLANVDRELNEIKPLTKKLTISHQRVSNKENDKLKSEKITKTKGKLVS